MLPDKNETTTTTNGANGVVREGEDTESNATGEDKEHDPQFIPIITLPEVHIPPLEEHEDVMVKLKAKLFRFDNSLEPPEWKERGTGEIKLLRHNERNTVRIVMRREKTWKICANHLICSWMQLKPNCGSDRAWVWSVSADYADEEPKPELLAARFLNSTEAKKFYDAFEEAKIMIQAEPVPDEFRDADESKSENDSEDDEESEISGPEEDNDAVVSNQQEDAELNEKISKVTVEENNEN